jgi:uncharacterized protein (TIGR03086 family)
MADTRASAASLGGIALLERAITYTLGSLHLVTPDALSVPTPCRDWDLRALLAHLDDALLALHQAGDGGRVDLVTAGAATGPEVDPVARLRVRACQLLGTWTAGVPDDELVSVAGRPLTAAIVTSTGAIEVAVHGWDVARACGRHHPLPPSLAEEMLDLVPLFVTDADRPDRFGPPVRVRAPGGPADRLLAFLGRDPH